MYSSGFAKTVAINSIAGLGALLISMLAVMTALPFAPRLRV
jgi:hypothetical protein